MFAGLLRGKGPAALPSAHALTIIFHGFLKYQVSIDFNLQLPAHICFLLQQGKRKICHGRVHGPVGPLLIIQDGPPRTSLNPDETIILELRPPMDPLGPTAILLGVKERFSKAIISFVRLHSKI